MNKSYDITKINFSDLRNQKRELMKAIKDIDDRQMDDDMGLLDRRQKEGLEGILHMIDDLQDFVTDELGYPAMEVYDFEAEDPDYHPEPLYPVNTDEPEEEVFAREMADIIYDLHREGTYLYQHEAMSEEFVETILNDPANVHACKELIRKDILDDFRIDPTQFKRIANTNDLCYDSEMYDYGYAIEAYCLEKFYEGKTKTVYLCKCCHSNNVEIKKWVNPNTGVVGEDCDESVGFCNDCAINSVIYAAELKYLAEIIGFQVVSDDDKGDIHPDMDASFCIYNLSQANAMIEKGCNNPQQQWRLLTIWRYDIEEPTLMYEGNPRG
jgi:hypothetical protein